MSSKSLAFETQAETWRTFQSPYSLGGSGGHCHQDSGSILGLGLLVHSKGAKCKFTFQPVRLGGSGPHCHQVSLAEM